MPRVRRKGALWMAAALCAALLFAPAAYAADTSASGAVVMEQSTRRVLYEKNAREKRPMASTTKVMTALVALENADLDEIVTVSARASGVEGSSLYLETGEKLTLRDLLYGLMLRSGNDAAVAIAEHVAGSVEEFVELMNQRAAELGAVDTHFVTPNGLDADGHVTTAYDLALITAQAMSNETFAQIVSTQRYTIPWEGHPWDRVVVNKNKLLTQYGADGVKTGYTKKAGRCLVGAKTQGEMQLISVVLNCGPMFEDSVALMDDCFARYAMVSVMEADQEVCFLGVEGGTSTYVTARTAQEIKVPLREEERGIMTYSIWAQPGVAAPVKRGDTLGEVCVTLGEGGEKLLRAPLCAGEDVPAQTFWWRVHNEVKRFLCRTWEKESDYKNILPGAASPPAENASN
ncbi:MAG: D-alanyl-D-alanine carboxypeptidase [Eubacteriales bacterium]|nr:D-alanyl-D-alanine carboxypeptidase [Eubacteriales bacterium]